MAPNHNDPVLKDCPTATDHNDPVLKNRPTATDHHDPDPKDRLTAPNLHDAPLPANTQEADKNNDIENELFYNGVWGALITVMSFMYGDMTIGRVLPKDQRQESWWWMHSPLPCLAMCLGYVAAVTWLGPRLMRNRAPVKGLKPFMMVYNAFQVLFNAYIVSEGGVVGWLWQYRWLCQPCDFSNDPMAVRMMHIAYWYWFSKMLDFFDTIFFVAHKKYSHISLLHVCHHALMPISMWYGVAYHPGGHNTFAGFINSFVHVVMYGYYLLAAMGPRMRPYLWWKKYLTSMQMIQFIMIFVHSILGAMVPDCNVPYTFIRWVGVMAVLFLILFTDFYIKAYRKRDGPKMGALQWLLQYAPVCYSVHTPAIFDYPQHVASSEKHNGYHNKKVESSSDDEYSLSSSGVSKGKMGATTLQTNADFDQDDQIVRTRTLRSREL